MRLTPRKGALGVPGLVASIALVAVSTGCTSGESPAAGVWGGTTDTLPSGALVVRNPRNGIWSAESRWRVTEVARIGTLEGTGPDLFGHIQSIAVDSAGRVYALESQAQEVRVFDRTGRYVRTIGRKGGGPGEIARGMAVTFAPDGLLWVLDPNNNRISMFDTAGTYIDGRRMLGSFFTSRWPGGFDREGRFYSFEPDPSPDRFFAFVQYDSVLQRLGTIDIPQYQGETFEYVSPDGNDRNSVGVPFAPYLVWQFDPRGYLWFGTTDGYHIVQRTLDGDTVRIVDRPRESVPVTAADRAEAMESLKWFTDAGGKVDVSRFPSEKPAYQYFVVDRVGNLWVFPNVEADRQGRVVDVFDPDGRYLGRLDLPFTVARAPQPQILDDWIYAVSEDDLGVQYLMIGKIDKGDG